MRRLEKLSDVVDWRLCIGCGACAYICRDDQVQLFDFFAEGIRPVVQKENCDGCRECLDVCPAVGSGLTDPSRSGVPHSTLKGEQQVSLEEWGPVLEIWEGYAIDPEVRFQGSSGGALTALSAYCLESAGMHGVLHIAQDEEDPLRNRTRLSRTRAELLAAAGSRYAPASACDHLEWVEEAPAPCVVIGKPGEIAALRNAETVRPKLKGNVGVALSFFCAESPPTRGTVALIEKLGMKPESIGELKYRGRGWPGYFAPVAQGETAPRHKLTYRESWAFLQAFRPWSVQIWPDGTGELADISCGDPWYEEPDGKNPGFSLVVVRTERGREIVRGAMAAGYLKLTPAEPWKLVKSQEGLIRKKGAVWGRLLMMRLFRLPAPNLRARGLFHCWLRLSWKEKLKSTFGTVRRIIARRLFRPLALDHSSAIPVRTGQVRAKPVSEPRNC